MTYYTNMKNCVDNSINRKDTFNFEINKNFKEYEYFFPSGIRNTPRSMLIRICRDNGIYCSTLIMSDGWRMKDDYPWD